MSSLNAFSPIWSIPPSMYCNLPDESTTLDFDILFETSLTNVSSPFHTFSILSSSIFILATDDSCCLFMLPSSFLFAKYSLELPLSTYNEPLVKSLKISTSFTISYTFLYLSSPFCHAAIFSSYCLSNSALNVTRSFIPWFRLLVWRRYSL